MNEPHQEQRTVLGFEVTLDVQLGHLMVAHDGAITWDQLQAVKNEVWGENARAIEVYPVQTGVVNAGRYRHLWRLGKGDFCPDLLAYDASDPWEDDSLEERHFLAWGEAVGVFA